MTDDRTPEAAKPQAELEEGNLPDVDQAADEIDPLAELQQELEAVKAREAEYLDGWQRARAELSNARKRFEREQQQAYANAHAHVLAQVLPIADDFERAFETLPENLSRLTWIQGLVLVHRKLQLLLEQAGVTPIEAVGKEFDPYAHQAVTHEPSDEVPAGYVIAELQKGYVMGNLETGGRVLRPSLVRVSSGPPPAETAGPGEVAGAEPAPEEAAAPGAAETD